MEFALLVIISVMPFMPVAINKQSGQALLLDPELEPGAAGFALRMLQRRGYVQVRADIPLQTASYHGYEDWKHGSAALLNNRAATLYFERRGLKSNRILKYAE